MYRHEDCEQLKLELPFGVTLREDNRWVILSKLFPWEAIEQEYAKNFTGEEGQVALPSRLAFGALYIQTSEHYTDEQTRRNIQENPYLQYFCGFECYTMESPFDASMMTHFRKRISAEMVRELQALVFAAEAAERQDTMPEPLQEAIKGPCPLTSAVGKPNAMLARTALPQVALVLYLPKTNQRASLRVWVLSSMSFIFTGRSFPLDFRPRSP